MTEPYVCPEYESAGTTSTVAAVVETPRDLAGQILQARQEIEAEMQAAIWQVKNALGAAALHLPPPTETPMLWLASRA